MIFCVGLSLNVCIVSNIQDLRHRLVVCFYYWNKIPKRINIQESMVDSLQFQSIRDSVHSCSIPSLRSRGEAGELGRNTGQKAICLVTRAVFNLHVSHMGAMCCLCLLHFSLPCFLQSAQCPGALALPHRRLQSQLQVQLLRGQGLKLYYLLSWNSLFLSVSTVVHEELILHISLKDTPLMTGTSL